MCVNNIETLLNSTKDEEEIETISTKTCSSSNNSSSSKENIKRPTLIRRRSHNKINKLATVHSTILVKNECQSRIHYFYKNKKSRISRHKSI